MIKVAVTGAETPVAGELIRILVHHPEVDLTILSAPGLEGVSVNKVHHGLIGDLNMRFAGPLSINPDCSVIFACGNSMTAAEFAGMRLTRPDIRMIAVDPIPNLDAKSMGIVFGLPEINRKPLVRGAMASQIPAPASSAILTALFPLANHMLLNDSLRINVSLPRETIERDRKRVVHECESTFREAELSFPAPLRVDFTPSAHQREMLIEITLSCSLDLDQIAEMYEVYDDHNFTHTVIQRISPMEAMGTNKCIIGLDKPDDSTLKIIVVADPKMRGAAGEAVHNMNLLFGLYEKTGLTLKTI